MNGRIYGCRPSDIKPTLVGSTRVSLPTPSSSTDLRSLCTYVDNQIGSKCVGEALGGAHWIATAGAGKRPSPRGIYVGARVRERARKTDPIPDVGCAPADAVDHIIEVGVYPRNSRDDDPGALNAMDTWDEALACQRIASKLITVIDYGDTGTLDACLVAKCGITFSMQVVPSYEAIRSWDIWDGPTGQDTDLGGHYQALCGSDPDSYWVWGSWGPNFGQGGFVRISRAYIAAQARDIVAMHGGPVL